MICVCMYVGKRYGISLVVEHFQSFGLVLIFKIIQIRHIIYIYIYIDTVHLKDMSIVVELKFMLIRGISKCKCHNFKSIADRGTKP